MTHRLHLMLVASVIGAQSAVAQAPAPRAVPNETSCPRCSIVVRPLVTLGTDDGVGSLNGKPRSVNVDSRGRYWIFQELEPPTVFSANGVVERMVGRKGSGPGEFRSANNGIVVGDSMLVFDWLESRATMLGPDLKTVRVIRFHRSLNDPVIIEWPRLLIGEGYVENGKPPNSTLHRFSLAGSEQEFLGSFGPRGTGGPMGNMWVQQRVSASRDGIWSAYGSRPEFTRWTRSGEAVTTLRRQLDWYTGESRVGLGSPTTAPAPRTGPIHEDQEGLIWLFIHRAAPTWKEAWPAKPTLSDREYRTRDIGYDRLFSTYVEVIDPMQARVVTSHTINGFVFEALSDRRVALYKVDENGIPRVQIVSLSLTGR